MKANTWAQLTFLIISPASVGTSTFSSVFCSSSLFFSSEFSSFVVLSSALLSSEPPVLVEEKLMPEGSLVGPALGFLGSPGFER